MQQQAALARVPTRKKKTDLSICQTNSFYVNGSSRISVAHLATTMPSQVLVAKDIQGHSFYCDGQAPRAPFHDVNDQVFLGPTGRLGHRAAHVFLPV